MMRVGAVGGAAVVLGALATVVRRSVAYATVRGTSMMPTFAEGQRVRAVRRRQYRVGDVVVFEVAATDPPWRIKRVAAVAGDATPAWLGTADRVVPAGHVVVRGDNPVSQDSRQLGYIPVRRIRGRVRRSAHR